MYTAIYLEVNLIGTAVLLLILHRSVALNDLQASRLAYRHVAWGTLAGLLLDALWILIEGRPGPVYIAINVLINVCSLALTGLTTYLWVRYVLCKLDREMLKNRWLNIALQLPLAVLLVLCILTPWTGWLFRITPANEYRRGVLLWVQQGIAFFYIALGAFLALRAAYHTTNREKRNEALTLGAFALFPTAGAALNVLAATLPSIWPMTALSLLMVHLDLQSRQISTDDLTGLNNRRQFDRYLAAKMEESHHGNLLYLLLLDIDAFKRINDAYGHLAGDKALVQTANVLKQTCACRNCFLARYGGDEFAIVLECALPDDAAQLGKELSTAFVRFNAEKAELYTLSVSVGAGMYSIDADTPERLIAQADQALYTAKSERAAAR